MNDVKRFKFDLDYFNRITKGGLPPKTLNIALAGTGVGNFTNSSSSFVITSGVQDADIIFKGYDSSSLITPLTLDMSDAGALLLTGGKIAN